MAFRILKAAGALAFMALSATTSFGQTDPLGAAPAARTDTSTIIVGSADFPESQLLATIYAKALAAKGIKVETKLSIGSREVYIPALLDGKNIILCAPTAGGKTEAAVAPLIELHCPPLRTRHGPRILYLTPTRALANDLAARLAHPLESLGLTLGIKTRDQSTFRPNRPPDLLLTTPESADSMLATQAKIFANLRAIVIDELHLFDRTTGNAL